MSSISSLTNLFLAQGFVREVVKVINEQHGTNYSSDETWKAFCEAHTLDLPVMPSESLSLPKGQAKMQSNVIPLGSLDMLKSNAPNPKKDSTAPPSPYEAPKLKEGSCCYVFYKGDHIGTFCNKKVVDDGISCRAHAGSIEKAEEKRKKVCETLGIDFRDYQAGDWPIPSNAKCVAAFKKQLGGGNVKQTAKKQAKPKKDKVVPDKRDVNSTTSEGDTVIEPTEHKYDGSSVITINSSSLAFICSEDDSGNPAMVVIGYIDKNDKLILGKLDEDAERDFNNFVKSTSIQQNIIKDDKLFSSSNNVTSESVAVEEPTAEETPNDDFGVDDTDFADDFGADDADFANDFGDEDFCDI